MVWHAIKLNQNQFLLDMVFACKSWKKDATYIKCKNVLYICMARPQIGCDKKSLFKWSKQPFPGFELKSQTWFPIMINIMLNSPVHMNQILYINIYMHTYHKIYTHAHTFATLLWCKW